MVVETKEKIDILIGEAERLLAEAKDTAVNIAHQGKKNLKSMLANAFEKDEVVCKNKKPLAYE